jgi:hypothetical protein
MEQRRFFEVRPIPPRIADYTGKRFHPQGGPAHSDEEMVWYSYQLDTLRVRLLLRLRRRCGWRRGCRGRSRCRARQQIPNENQGKDNCRCDDEQPVCVHRVCPRFSLPHHVSPPWGSGTSQTIRAENITWLCSPRGKLNTSRHRHGETLYTKAAVRLCAKSALSFVAPHI